MLTFSVFVFSSSTIMFFDEIFLLPSLLLYFFPSCLYFFLPFFFHSFLPLFLLFFCLPSFLFLFLPTSLPPPCSDLSYVYIIYNILLEICWDSWTFKFMLIIKIKKFSPTIFPFIFSFFRWGALFYVTLLHTFLRICSFFINLFPCSADCIIYIVLSLDIFFSYQVSSVNSTLWNIFSTTLF